MKRTAFALLVLTCVLPLRADILVNGNFADGHAHWEGDMVDIDSADSSTNLSPDGAGNAAGVVIKLKKDKWTKIYQNFTIRDPKLFYTITYKLSPDYKLSGKSQDMSSIDLSDVPGFYSSWSLPETSWALLINGFYYSPKYLQPNAKKTGEPQTLTGRLTNLTDSEAILLLALPPGEGSVTLLNISLSVTDPNAEP